MDFLSKLRLAAILIPILLGVRLAAKLYVARMRVRKLKAQGIPVMTHSFLFGHIPIVVKFYKEWHSDANFVQNFGYYVSKNWQRFFPLEDRCPPVVYVDVWPIATPVGFTLEAYVSNQISIGSSLKKSALAGQFLGPMTKGRDLNCLYGEEWKIWRSRFNPGFSQANIRPLIPAIVEETEAFMDVLQSKAGLNGEWGQVFQLESISGALAFDVIGRVILDIRMNAQSPDPSPFAVAYREQLQNMEITLSPRKLLWRATPMFRLAVNRKRRQLFDYLRPFIVSSIGLTTSGPKTVVRAAVEESRREAPSKESGPDRAIDDAFIELVCCQLMIFFFGGEDAITLTAAWIFKQLQSHPECLEKLRAEHDSIFGADPNVAAQKLRDTPHILDSLPYTLAIVKETLRLNPATITIREGNANFFLNVKDYGAPWPSEGFDLYDSSITIHRDPANFPRASEFIPERWTVAEGHPLHPPKNVWRAFQLGPRQCIGRELAVVVLKLMLVLVVRKFDIEMAWEEWDKLLESQGLPVTKQTVDGERMYTTGKATAHPKDGAPVRVRARY